MSKKSLIILVVVVVIVGGGIYLVKLNRSSKQEPASNQKQVVTNADQVVDTSDWKTYKNEAYSFNFKYPKDWQLETKSDGIVLLSPTTKADIKARKVWPGGDVILYTYKTIKELDRQGRGSTSLVDYLNKYSEPGNIASYNSTDEYGYPAYEAIIGGEGQYYGVYKENNGKIIEIIFNYRLDKSKLTATDKNILTSFNFTN